MPPANNSFATATNIASLPFSFTQTDINDAGVNFTVYYKFIAPVGVTTVGVLGFSGNLGAGYRPNNKPYLGPAGAPTHLLVGATITAQNLPFYFPVTPGLEYFIEFVKNVDTAGPEDLLVIVEAAPNLAAVAGSIMVNDDQPGMPMGLFSPSVANVAFKYVPDIVAGEVGDILTNGVFALHNAGGTTLDAVVYNRDFSVLATRTFASSLIGLRRCDGLNKFFCTTNANPAIVRDILPDGSFGSFNKTLTGSGFLQTAAASNDGTILYYFSNSAGVGSALRRWDLVNNVALSDLAAGVPTYIVCDVMVLSDGNIIAMYFKSNDCFIRRYSPAGALLTTYAIGAIVSLGATISTLAKALDNPTSFWSRHHINFGDQSIFTRWNTATGAAITALTYDNCDVGKYMLGEGPSTTKYGPSSSCPFMILASANYPGIYIIEPGKIADTVNNGGSLLDIAIPDPTFRTGLIG